MIRLAATTCYNMLPLSEPGMTWDANSGAGTVPDTEHRSSKLPWQKWHFVTKGMVHCWFTVGSLLFLSLGHPPVGYGLSGHAINGDAHSWALHDEQIGENQRYKGLRHANGDHPALRHDKINKKLCRKESQLCCYPSYPFAHVCPCHFY